eukprot:scaffold3159_cov393-Prasinococcus_capsulatus_cf.AAC.25
MRRGCPTGLRESNAEMGPLHMEPLKEQQGDLPLDRRASTMKNSMVDDSLIDTAPNQFKHLPLPESIGQMTPLASNNALKGQVLSPAPSGLEVNMLISCHWHVQHRSKRRSVTELMPRREGDQRLSTVYGVRRGSLQLRRKSMSRLAGEENMKQMGEQQSQLESDLRELAAAIEVPLEELTLEQVEEMLAKRRSGLGRGHGQIQRTLGDGHDRVPEPHGAVSEVKNAERSPGVDAGAPSNESQPNSINGMLRNYEAASLFTRANSNIKKRAMNKRMNESGVLWVKV